jgi:hypothetical protein
MTKQTGAQGLDCELETLRNDLQEAEDLVVRLYDSLDHTRITPAKTRVEIASLFDEPLPQEGQPMRAILHEVEMNIFANSRLYLSPRFLGYINSGGKSSVDSRGVAGSAVNQICAKSHFSPGFRGGTAGDPMDRAVHRVCSRSGRVQATMTCAR